MQELSEHEYQIRQVDEGVRRALFPPMYPKQAAAAKIYSSPVQTRTMFLQAGQETSPRAIEDFDLSFAQLNGKSDPFQKVPDRLRPAAVSSKRVRQLRKQPNPYPSVIAMPNQNKTKVVLNNTFEAIDKESTESKTPEGLLKVTKETDKVSNRSNTTTNVVPEVAEEEREAETKEENTASDTNHISDEEDVKTMDVLNNISESADEVHIDVDVEEEPPLRMIRQRRDLKELGAISRTLTYLQETSDGIEITSYDDDRYMSDDDSMGVSILTSCGPGVTSLGLQIDELSPVNFLNVLTDLTGNPHIKELTLYRKDTDDETRTRSLEELSLFYATLETMPALKILKLHNFEASELDELNDLLDQSSTLSKLVVDIHCLTL